MKVKFLCASHYINLLIWRVYGYWSKNFGPPTWVNDPSEIEELEFLIKYCRKPDLRIRTSPRRSRNYWSCDYEFYDINNPFIKSYTGAVSHCKSESAAVNYAHNRYREIKRLYDGDIEAFLTYKETGIACLPNWNTNKTDSYGYKDDKKNRVPRAKEVQPDGTIKPHKDYLK